MKDLREESDAFLMGSIANGDADAVRPLIERHQRPLFALLRRALGASVEVEDIAQETWIRVVRSARRYDPQQQFTGWLFAIAWNLVRDRWKKMKKFADAELESMPSGGASAEDDVIERDCARRLRDLVATLPDRLAEPVFLRYFEELSEREVAARLGVPVGTVKSRIHNALHRLKGELT
ncbi:MAG TPA: sigma-70 family RNA polymerase sigma factor [Thermoanaerobaculia bacterium]